MTPAADRLTIAMLSLHSCPLGRLGTRDTGGMSVYIREVARCLASQGHRVDIFTRHHDPLHGPVIKLAQGVRLIHLKAGPDLDPPKLSLVNHVEEFVSSLARFRCKTGISYDLIHSHYWLSGLAGLKLQKLWSVPHVTMFHTLAAVKNRMSATKCEPRLRVLSEEKVAGSCDLVVAATDQGREELSRHYGICPGLVRVIPCGVDLDRFRPADKAAARMALGLDRKERVVLYVGRIDPLKGLDRLMGAMARLDSLPGLKLIIVGGDDGSSAEMRWLKDLVGQNGLDRRVCFAGRIDQSGLPAFYQAADLLVLPSYHETFGLVALEAMACGAPVVTTRVGGMTDLVRPGLNGRLVRGEVVEGLAKAVRSTLADVRTGLFPPEVVRSSVRGYEWSQVAQTLLSEYRELLSGCLARAS